MKYAAISERNAKNCNIRKNLQRRFNNFKEKIGKRNRLCIKSVTIALILKISSKQTTIEHKF